MTTRTFGVEEEFLLFRRDEPVLLGDGPAVVRAAARIAGAAAEGGFEKELKTAQTEHASPVARTLDGLAATVREQRDTLAAAAAGRGGRLVAAGVSPVAGEAVTTPDDRYAEMAGRFAALEHEQLACAMHVHVSVESDDEGVAVLDRIAPWLHVPLALTANSPIRAGRDTGYASYRRVLWGMWPTAGPAGPFGAAAAYHTTVESLVATGAARDPAMIYFDARLSADYPTVEIRVCDVVTDAQDAVTVAGLLRGLVTTVARDSARPTVRVELLRAGAWCAARYGMTDRLPDLSLPDGPQLMPAWQLADRLLQLCRDALDETGDLDAVRDGLARIRERGTGAQRQRRAARDGDAAAALEVATVRAGGAAGTSSP